MCSFTIFIFKKQTKNPHTIVLDLTFTGGSKMHFNRCQSSLTQNSLNAQKFVAPVPTYNICKYSTLQGNFGHLSKSH